MATTTNFGWDTPDDTDLVKDGASAIRTLGSSIDTSFVDLKGGTTGQVLAKASNTDLDFTWSADAVGGMTQLATGTLSGAAVNLTGISGLYTDLLLIIRNFKPSVDGANCNLRFNSDSNANRYFNRAYADFSSIAFDQDSGGEIISGSDDTTASGLAWVRVYDYANATTWKMSTCMATSNGTTTATQANGRFRHQFYNQTGAITAINLYPSSGNFTSGTYILYGVK